MTETTLYDRDAEAAEDWFGRQVELARRAVTIGWERSREIRERLDRTGVRPGDVRGLDDLSRLPVLSKDDLPERQRRDPPFGGMLGVRLDQLRAVYQSPGPILDPHGDRPDYWRVAPALWAAGFRAGNVVQNTFSYHLTPAGAMFDEGLRALGCVVVPAGVGNTDEQVRLLARVGAIGYVGTPGFVLTLLQRAREHNMVLALVRAFVSGGPLPPALRREIEIDFHVDVYQGYGTADAGLLGYECQVKDGWHVAPGAVVEITDPATGQPVAPGTPGEVVATCPNEVYPLVRFGTGDLSALNVEPCSCGRTSPRLVGFLGRVGEGIKVRGMFVHPRQLAEAMATVPAVARYQGIVSQREHRDEFTVRVEGQPNAELVPKILADVIRTTVKVRAEVEVVGPGTIADDAPALVDMREVS